MVPSTIHGDANAAAANWPSAAPTQHPTAAVEWINRRGSRVAGRPDPTHTCTVPRLTLLLLDRTFSPSMGDQCLLNGASSPPDDSRPPLTHAPPAASSNATSGRRLPTPTHCRRPTTARR